MLRPNWAIPACFVETIVLAVLTNAQPALPQTTAGGPDQTVTAEQRKQIEAAKSVADLTSLAKQYLLVHKEAAARLCVEQICVKEPKLLTDPEPQTSSRPWNDFWFTCRAEMQAKKLAPKDAAGRLELARWLKQGGVFGPARGLVNEALQIDPGLSEAKALLAELEPPAQLDFRYALTKPVFLTEYMDQNVKVEAGRGYLLLLAPVRYRATEVRLSLIPGTIKVSADVGKMARVLGLLLTEEPPKGDPRATGGTGGAIVTPIQPTVPTPAVPPDQVPDTFTTTFYERLQIELKDGLPTLTWHNTYTSRPTNPADRATGGSRTTGGTRGSAGGLSAREALAEKRGEMPANGWLGLLIKFPEDANTLTIELPEAPPESIDLNLLKLTQQQQASTGQPSTIKPDDSFKAISKFATDSSAPTAQLATAWIGQHASAQTGSAGQVSATEIEAVRVLLAAGGHPDRRVRQAGFEGLMQHSGALPDEALDFLREEADEKTLAGLLDQVDVALSAGASLDPAATASVAPGATSEPVLGKILETMPASQAPANAFVILGACINSRRSQARQEALRILLNDGSQQSLQILAVPELRKDAQKTLAAQFAKIKNPDMKAAVLRLLLVNPESATVTTCLAACGDLAVKVSTDDDPLLTALQADNEKVNAKAKEALLLLLSRSDLSAIADSQKFTELLKSVEFENEKMPAVRSALLAMAAAQLRLPYQAPFARATKSGPSSPEQQAGGCETVLAKGAVDPKINQASAEKAALMLVASGRLEALKKQFIESKDVDRCVGIIRMLAKTKELWQRESLPVFLAAALGNENEEVRKETLSTLAILHDNCDKNNRWRINLAVRQGLDINKAVDLTFDPTTRIAEQATALIKRTVGMTLEEARDFDASTTAPARVTCLTERIVGGRTKNPVGQYACLVLVDAEVTAQPGAAQRPAQAAPTSRTNVPLTSARVTIKRGSGDALEILADDVEIGRQGDQADAGGDTAGQTQPGSLSANPAELLIEALRSDDARREGFAGKVDLRTLRDSLRQEKCELRPEPLGGWSAELNINTQGTSDNPIRIVAAKIILQPLNP
ncbi:MAG: hypothetical protein GX616_12470 [Planctomycetes bacterium]|nr:hypothetical protein [Planctomycetota bacterium]